MSEVCHECFPNESIFAGLAARIRTYNRGEILFRQGEAATNLFLIQKGSVKLSRITDSGEESIVQIAAMGEMLGLSPLFHHCEHFASCQALEPVVTYLLDRDTLEKAIRQNPDLAWDMVCKLACQLDQSRELLDEQKTLSAEQKVRGLFCRLACDYGQPHEGGFLIPFQLTQEEIASMVGISRAMVVRITHQMETRGELYRQKRRYLFVKKKKGVPV